MPELEAIAAEYGSSMLVVDCYANAATVDVLRNATPAPLDGSTEEQLSPVLLRRSSW